MLEGKLLNPNEKLVLQKEIETKIPDVIIDLKQEVNLSTNSLDKELNSHEILINEFKNKIDVSIIFICIIYIYMMYYISVLDIVNKNYVFFFFRNLLSI